LIALSSTLGGSVVIATRNRHEQLHACLRALAVALEASTVPVEVIVVDDGSEVPVRSGELPIPAVLLRLDGAGPAAARNAGITRSRGQVILFTDDDTQPCRTWITAALDYLSSHTSAIGVEGPVTSRDWDPLHEHSMRMPSPGHYVTANVAYRRDTLVAIGGFREGLFRFAHAEDRDIAARALRQGTIGFAPEMVVDHTPRPVTLEHVARQAKWARDDIVLFANHPELVESFRLPVRIALIWGSSSVWLGFARARDPRSPRRWLRGLIAFIVAGAVTTWTVLTTPPARVLRLTPPGSDAQRRQSCSAER
jgi:GT2 family glycosyltransferase